MALARLISTVILLDSLIPFEKFSTNFIFPFYRIYGGTVWKWTVERLPERDREGWRGTEIFQVFRSLRTIFSRWFTFNRLWQEATTKHARHDNVFAPIKLSRNFSPWLFPPSDKQPKPASRPTHIDKTHKPEARARFRIDPKRKLSVCNNVSCPTIHCKITLELPRNILLECFWGESSTECKQLLTELKIKFHEKVTLSLTHFSLSNTFLPFGLDLFHFLIWHFAQQLPHIASCTSRRVSNCRNHEIGEKFATT